MTCEPYDPCDTARRLREAYVTVLEGGSVRSVRHRSGDEERETTFGPQNVAELRRAMLEAEAACIATQTSGGAPRRRPIRVGARRTFW